MAENGKLPDSALSTIPEGRLDHDAAAAWNAPGGPADAGLVPTGPRSSYRTYADQVEFWNNQPPLAAQPGTSNHGWGLAVDLREPWMRAWIDEHGARYAWRKTEAPSEWWHVNFDGSKDFPSFETLSKGDRGKRVKKYSRRLAFIHAPKRKGGNAYLRRAVGRFGRRMAKAVREFQADQGLLVDGKIGPRTAGRINAVFQRQYHERHEARPRGSAS